jgi:hypothetical protein
VIDFRLRNGISDAELGQKIGRIVTPRDINLILTGPAYLRKPNGQPLCVYLPGAIPADIGKAAFPVLHSLRSQTTDNRGIASGTPIMRRGERNRSSGVSSLRSAIIGAFDSSSMRRYCRLTAWTAAHYGEIERLFPLLRVVAAGLAEHVPERYGAQMRQVEQTDPAWRLGDTPFSTLTVNNTYPTGVHMDDGDLDAGFSAITVLRRGNFQGGLLTFPRYRVGVDLGDRDVILMDAHEWHGNTDLTCGVCGGLVRRHAGYANGPTLAPPLPCQAKPERISLVTYYRTDMVACGTYEQELQRAHASAAVRSGV